MIRLVILIVHSVTWSLFATCPQASNNFACPKFQGKVTGCGLNPAFSLSAAIFNNNYKKIWVSFGSAKPDLFFVNSWLYRLSYSCLKLNYSCSFLKIYIVAPFVGTIIAVLFWEMLLSDGASVERIKHWWTDPDFDRTKDYKRLDREAFCTFDAEDAMLSFVPLYPIRSYSRVFNISQTNDFGNHGHREMRDVRCHEVWVLFSVPISIARLSR